MSKTSYYELIDEYQRLVSQKQFNEYFLDKNRLSEVKAILDRTLRKLIINTAVQLFEFERKAKRHGIKHDTSPKYKKIEERLNSLKRLRDKILLEEQLEEGEYEGSYFEPVFIAGLTFPQTCIVLLAGIVIFIIYRFCFA